MQLFGRSWCAGGTFLMASALDSSAHAPIAVTLAARLRVTAASFWPFQRRIAHVPYPIGSERSDWSQEDTASGGLLESQAPLEFIIVLVAVPALLL